MFGHLGESPGIYKIVKGNIAQRVFYASLKLFQGFLWRRTLAALLVTIFFVTAFSIQLCHAAPPCTTLHVDQETMVEILCSRVRGMTPQQAQCLMQQSFSRDACFTVGGSRVRGDCRLLSDLDVGFCGPDPLKPAAGCLSERQIKRIIGNCGKCGPLQLEPTPIMPGYQPNSGCFEPIQSPEEFFGRCGVRSGGPRAGRPFGPSGSITCAPNGMVRIIEPPPPARRGICGKGGIVLMVILSNDNVQGGVETAAQNCTPLRYGLQGAGYVLYWPSAVMDATGCGDYKLVDAPCYGFPETIGEAHEAFFNMCRWGHNDRDGWHFGTYETTKCRKERESFPCNEDFYNHKLKEYLNRPLCIGGIEMIGGRDRYRLD